MELLCERYRCTNGIKWVNVYTRLAMGGLNYYFLSCVHVNYPTLYTAYPTYYPRIGHTPVLAQGYLPTDRHYGVRNDYSRKPEKDFP